MAIPKTCKFAVCEAKGAKLVIKEMPVPEPQAGEILIKVIACGVCHSDSAAIDGNFGDTVSYPVIPGHETVGTVVALGSAVTKWKVGDLVGGAWHGGHDGTCRSCQRGLFQMCQKEAINGITRIGGYAEYTTLRSEAAVSLPTNIDKAEMAPLLCAGVTVFNGIRKMNIEQGGVVAIQGLGGLGHLAVQYARKMGYRTVALSSSDSKRDFATKLGATDYVDGSKEKTIDALQAMGGADLIVVTAPNPKLVTDLPWALAPMGKVLILAAVGDITVSTTPMIMKGVSLYGWPSGHALDSEEAIEFAQRQEVNCMVERFPLDKAQEALEYMLSGKVRFRAVLCMD